MEGIRRAEVDNAGQTDLELPYATNISSTTVKFQLRAYSWNYKKITRAHYFAC